MTVTDNEKNAPIKTRHYLDLKVNFSFMSGDRT